MRAGPPRPRHGTACRGIGAARACSPAGFIMRLRDRTGPQYRNDERPPDTVTHHSRRRFRDQDHERCLEDEVVVCEAPRDPAASDCPPWAWGCSPPRRCASAAAPRAPAPRIRRQPRPGARHRAAQGLAARSREARHGGHAGVRAAQHRVGAIDFDENARCSILALRRAHLQAFADLGDDVVRGKPLYTIDSPDLQQAESTLIPMRDSRA